MGHPFIYLIKQIRVRMKTVYYLIIRVCILFLLGCNTDNPGRLEKHFQTKMSGAKDIRLTGIDLEPIKLDSIGSSYSGGLSIRNDSLYFTDEMFCWVFVFNKEGKLQSRHLGQGRGPNEVPTGQIVAYTAVPGGGYFIIGGSWDCYHFDENWYRINDFMIGWQIKHSKSEMLKNPLPDEHMLYSISYHSIIKIRATKTHIYFPIYSQHPTFNAVSTAYIKHGRIIAKMNMNNGKVEKIMGRHSPEYLKYRFLLFDFFSFDISEDNRFFVCHPTDSLIYIYNMDFKIQGAFGYGGRDMDKKYIEVQTLEQCSRFFELEMEKRGYYSWLEYIDEKDLLFRSYAKGSHSDTDGLQIYKGTTMIADIDVPKRLYVKGYFAPYFYSDAIIDENNETITVYRFKLDI